MPQFAYKARKRTGEVVQGVLDVSDRSAALVQIERLGLFPVMVDSSRAGVATAAAVERKEAGMAKAVLPGSVSFGLRRRRKPKLQELATYTQQLANLLKC